ncbi:hypothetical protein A7985_09410 [Pseudoalteromonas luteoviolacea]|uniref:DUF2878 domain-containing protein n=1 Tax=Pseudoalteromonas luteoviolacea TaxID=43657 RepID=A0A1C0TRZ2_9GAMM|nr:DUF2878 domain-containing protein [Pseudoalteromonas luteoviolacea]MBQ4810653.1 DUF2878 domain-containing protein [Pseudoalteromonas luteoviolacea]OCQ22012.1 hypothetical protein A7985_09410 [Pseudoalteromonas luteoviolacea]
MRQYSVIINFVLFQSAWFAVFFLKHQSIPVLLLVIGIMAVVSPNKKRDVPFVICGLGIGILVELIATSINVIQYIKDPIPIWLVLLWCALLFSFRESLSKLFTLPIKLRLLLVWLGAPASYYAGQQAGLLNTIEPVWAFWLVYGGLWYCGFEALRYIDKHPKLMREKGTSSSVST